MHILPKKQVYCCDIDFHQLFLFLIDSIYLGLTRHFCSQVVCYKYQIQDWLLRIVRACDLPTPRQLNRINGFS